MEFTVESCKQSREKIERRHQEEKGKRDTLQIRYSQLIDKARQYAKVLKDFQGVNSSFQVKNQSRKTVLIFIFRRSVKTKR